MRVSFKGHWLWPFALFALCALLLDEFSLDQRLADWFYALEGSHWALRRHWLFDTVIHAGGRYLVGIGLFAVIAGLVMTWLEPSMRRYRAGLFYLLATVVAALSVVSIAKSVTHISCPWNLARYGGDVPFEPLYHSLFGAGTGRCFPAGHSSGGYAWVALYFFFLHSKPQWRRRGLVAGLAIGGLFGVAQQLRGAHFLSHDLWTLAICWFIALIGYQCFLQPAQAREPDLATYPTPTDG